MFEIQDSKPEDMSNALVEVLTATKSVEQNVAGHIQDGGQAEMYT